MIKRILNFIWTAWCAIIIFSVIIILLPVFAVAVHSGIPAWRIWAHKVVLGGAKIVLFLWGIRFKVHNQSLVDPKEQFIYIGNHRSDLDAIITLGFLKGYWKYLGKAELLKWPLIGYLVGQIYITVNRSDRQSREQSVREMESKVNDGASITIFPEGWSNFSDEYLLPLKQGAFKLALSTHMPLAVFTIIGSHELWPKPNMRVRPGTVHIYWEGIIDPLGLEGNEQEKIQQINEMVHGYWLTRLKQHYPNGYDYPEDYPDFWNWQKGQLKK